LQEFGRELDTMHHIVGTDTLRRPAARFPQLPLRRAARPSSMFHHWALND